MAVMGLGLLRVVSLRCPMTK
ncbi:hypothetical protein KO530_21320 [Aliiglaciecola lipolytica]|nr:hypothetical protein [Aliiglaciecola lipolytica]